MTKKELYFWLKGSPLWLILTIILFLVLRLFFNTVYAIGISIFLLFIFPMFNVYQGSIGLINSNLKSYFLLRNNNYDHKKALQLVLNTRYPKENHNYIDFIRKHIYEASITFKEPKNSGISIRKPKKTDYTQKGAVTLLVLAVFCRENGPAPRLTADKVVEIISEKYDHLEEKYLKGQTNK